MNALRDRIWITSKARMNSERRYRRYNVASHLFLTYMSFLMIIASVFSAEFSIASPHFQKITITLAVFLFTTSLIIYGFNFSEMANKHRECYLRLQGLEQRFEKQNDPGGTYQEIFSGYPNHAPSDYEDFVLDRCFFRKEKIHVGDAPITWSWWMLLKKILRFGGFWLAVLTPPTFTTIIFFKSILYDPNGLQ